MDDTDFTPIRATATAARALTFTAWYLVETARGNDMLQKDVSEKIDGTFPKPHILTEEESMRMRENLAQKNFGMSFAEFAKAWNTGEFAYDRERHGKVISLAMLLTEYWED